MARTPKLHNLRDNSAERSPRRLLVVDTETRWTRSEDREEHSLRLWCARLVQRSPGADVPALSVDRRGHTADELADLVQELATSAMPTWLYTHNLGFDLTVTRLPVLLLERDWEIGRHSLASEQPWAHFSRGSRSLQLADSASWFPVSVEKLGELLDIPKLELPDGDDSDEAWFARCSRDVEILSTALVQLLEEWDRRRMGSWSVTGPASAWNSMLHMAPGGAQRRGTGGGSGSTPAPPGAQSQRTVIDPDPDARTFERRAIYSGRRDVWRWGWQPTGDFTEIDFRSAHLTICAYFLLPDRRGHRFESMDLDDWHIGSAARSVIAECTVHTDSPRYPLRLGRSVWHPVGTFKTVLCGPELEAARDRGDLLEIGPGYTYRLGRQMQPWAQWALSLLQGPLDKCDPMLWTFLKSASRSVPGRWAMMTSRELLEGPSHVSGWSLERAAFGRPPQLGAILHMAGRWLSVVRDQEAEDSFPAVLAHIQAWDRLLLQRALDALPADSVLQCNTDSVVLHSAALLGQAPAVEPGQEDGRAARELLHAGTEALSRTSAPLSFQVKRQGARCLLLSPQHVLLAEERKFAGVPRGAVEVEPYAFQFWTWPRLPSQLYHGEQGIYERRRKVVHLKDVPIPRWAYRCGCTAPVRAGLTFGGETEFVRPDEPRCGQHDAGLREAQHPVLARLR